MLVGTLYATSIFTECTAVPQTDRVIITWTTKSEVDIKYFSVLRSNDDVNFIELRKVNPTGPGSTYEFIDENVMFKDASVLFYKVRAVNKSNLAKDESRMIVHPNISNIFRTWGAIKAMFR